MYLLFMQNPKSDAYYVLLYIFGGEFYCVQMVVIIITLPCGDLIVSSVDSIHSNLKVVTKPTQ